MSEWQPEQPCPLCDGQGFVGYNVPVGHPLFGKIEPCECRTEQLLRRICGLAPNEYGVRLSSIITDGKPGATGMVALARQFVDRPANILTVYGGVGSAKTIVLQAIVNECITRRIEAVYMTFYELLDFVKRAFDRDDEGYLRDGSLSTRLNKLTARRVLCIDEVDKIRATDWVTEIRTELFDRRYRDMGNLGTVLAMNTKPDDCLPEWICSRLYDGRNAVFHNIDKDMRPLIMA